MDLGQIINTNIANLRTLPKKIFELENLITRTTDIKKLVDQIRNIVLETEYTVSLATDNKGRAKYSNADKRKNEVRKRLKENKVYQKMQTEIEGLELKLQLKQNELEFLKKKLGAEKALATELAGIVQNGYIATKMYDAQIIEDEEN